MLEEEQKYEVPSSFRLPKLTGLVPKSAKVLDATYYDTADLRLARAGASLRYRQGDELPWTVKLATGIPGVRQEISQAGKPGKPPAELRWLVTSLTRGAPLKKVAQLHQERQRWDLVAEGEAQAEIADDTVTSGTLTFRELEVERKAGSPKLLSTVDRALRKAGATPSPWPSKLARVLAVQDPPDLVPAGDPPSSHSAPQDMVTWAVRTHVRRILDHDPLMRLGLTLPDGDTPVHQLRVGCRRLRSALRAFAPVLQKPWATQIRDELGWFASLLGAARDTEVLRNRLALTAAADLLAPMDPAVIEAIDATLAQRKSAALAGAAKAMRGKRYVDLIELLTLATHEIPFAKRPSAKATAELTGAPAKKLAREVSSLTADAPDEQWHKVRIHVKRARYTAEAAGQPKAVVKSLAALQDLLGEHQDAAVAAEVWLSFAGDPALAVTAGRLYERERAFVRQARQSFAHAWRTMPAGGSEAS